MFNHQGWLKQLQLTANIILMKDHFDSPVEVNDLLVLCSEGMAPFLFSEPSIFCLFLTSASLKEKSYILISVLACPPSLTLK